MLGTISYITNNINEQPWFLDDCCGLKFEDHIFNVICHALEPLFEKGIYIYRTPRTRDDGKDIIIESTISFELFGINFLLKGKKNIRIYIESKSSKRDKIDLDKFSKNILIANRGDIDYLVLVTNSTISPFSYFQAMENAKDYNYEFILVDQYLLYSFLKDNDAVIGKYCEPQNKESISVSYQISKGSCNEGSRFDLYLFFRNNEKNVSVCTFRLKTDRNWKLSNSDFKILLEPHKAICKKIVVEKEYFDGIDSIILDFTINQQHKIVEINGTSINYRYEMPLVGENHKKIINDLDQRIYLNTSIQLFFLHGNAGIGKTRIVEEISKKILTRGIHLIYFRCLKRNNQRTTDAFLDALGKTKEFSTASSVSSTLESAANKFSKYVIIIEDIHNASDEFYDEISNINDFGGSIVPISIIVTGRDDYTVYNEAYFAFMDLLLHKSRPKFLDIKICPLSDSDSFNLIKSIIAEAPKSIIKKIQNASQNIPFYIAQFIEYMLDTKLIYLVNRNTIGITNVSTFNQKIYIPRKIEDIIEKRYKNLLHYKNGVKLQQFLLILAYCELEFEKKYLIYFFEDEELDSLEVLFKARFLKETHSGNIIFEHDNIFYYIQKKVFSSNNLKRICKTLYDCSHLFDQLDILKKGQIFLNLNDYKNALLCFKDPIFEIERMSNISSENVSALYIEYMKDIYFLQKHFHNKRMQRKTIIANIYLAVHNQENGKAIKTFESCSEVIEKYHRTDTGLKILFEQLQSHFYMQNGMLTKAQKGMNELIAKERSNPELFSDEIRFNLFDRFSSLNLQFNHKQPAILYNELSKNLATQMEDSKLLTLAYITDAKINFYENTKHSYNLMNCAKKLLEKTEVLRINCHNELSLLTAEILLKETSYNKLIKRAFELLHQAQEIQYPSAEIRSHFLLAVLLYLDKASLETVKSHIENAITMSLRYGNAKLMAPIYDLKAMIAIAEGQSIETIYKYYSTMMQYLKQQNLLFLGGLDFGYSNIINLTNYAKFLINYGLESEIYHMMSEISYYGSEVMCDFNCDKSNRCYYCCQKNIEVFKNNCKRIKESGLLFLDKKYKYDLLDSKSNCLIPIGV